MYDTHSQLFFWETQITSVPNKKVYDRIPWIWWPLTCSQPSFDCFPDILHTNICIPRCGQRLAIESFLGASNSLRLSEMVGNSWQTSPEVWKLHQPPNQRWKMFGICGSLQQATSFLGWVWWVFWSPGKCSSSLLCISFGNLWLVTKSPYVWCQRSHSGIIIIVNYYILLPLVALVTVLLLSFMDRILLQLRYMEHCWTSS